MEDILRLLRAQQIELKQIPTMKGNEQCGSCSHVIRIEEHDEKIYFYKSDFKRFDMINGAAVAQWLRYPTMAGMS
ncbi:hypothetical protein TNCV_201541 [Trichonephila clavipes]|nr:hypothetical protein TNCV_201541 [Trichonephila clavipes]